MVRFFALPLLVILLGILGYVVQSLLPVSDPVNVGSFTHGAPVDVGRVLFRNYLLPFEVTSVLILIAIIGAIVLARKEIE